MSPKRKIEVFTAGCTICDEALSQIKAAACPDCYIIVYDLREDCETMECRDKPHEHGIKAVPDVVIDAKLADSGDGRGVELYALKKAG